MTAVPQNLRGRFIVLDGPDGSGKSTQTCMLAKWLTDQGVPVLATRDPGGTPIGDAIRQVLLARQHAEMSVQTEALLYMASRAQLVEQVIGPALERRQCVLCDRLISSTLAYQGAGGADLDAIMALARFAVGKLWPDLTIILDLPPEIGLARAQGKDRVEAKSLEYHARVRQGFLDQARRQGQRYVVIDGAGTLEQVQEGLRQTLLAWTGQQ